MHFEEWLLVASVLLLLSILAWKASNRVGIPALLLFLGIGMLAGSDGPGGIYFDNAFVAQSIGVVALAFILFAGGLDTQWKVVRPALGGALALSTIGVLLTAVVVALFLTIGLTRLLTDPQESVFATIVLFVQQIGVGAICGLVLGWGAIMLISRLKLDAEGLYPVLTIALVLLTYGLTATLGGSGFLAVYLVGLLLGNSSVQRVDRLTKFHDGLAWVMQIGMFLVLGLLVFPSHLPAVFLNGLLITAIVVFIARPVSVLLVLLPTKMLLPEKLFVSWVGLRGAVPIVLATFPLLAGLHNASILFDLVFFVVLASVLLQGASVSLVAKWLGVVKDVSPQGWRSKLME